MKYLYILVFCLAVFVRLYNFGNVPPAAYWDEVSLGYDAYSILKTGKDHHGNELPIVAFESYGDWKPSGYYYALLPFIGVFGLNDFALRLPSMLAGLLIVIGVGFLAKQIKVNPLVAMFVTSISPWAIQFSRAGWEVNLATACIVWAVIAVFKAIQSAKLNLRWQLLSVLLFVFSMYTYHAARIVAPLLAVGVYLLQFSLLSENEKISVQKISKILKANLLKYIGMVVFGLILLSPLLMSLGKTETTQRFQETSIFNNLDSIVESNNAKLASGNSILSKILYHRYVLFGREILKNYFSQFSIDFLFLSGDKNPRHSVQFYGQLYHIELVFLLLGIYSWARNWTYKKAFYIFWLLIAIVPAAITHASPHALRTLPALPIFLLLIATGIEELLYYLQRVFQKVVSAQKYTIKKNQVTFILWAGLIGVYVLEFLPFWTFYQKIYPVKYSHEWQYGYAEVMPMLASFSREFPEDTIYVSREQGRPAMYYWYYNQIDPVFVQDQESSAHKDQSEFLQYDNLIFVTNSSEVSKEKALVAGSPEFFSKLESNYSATIIKSVSDLENKTIWEIGWVVRK